jgi:hypothetical protein
MIQFGNATLQISDRSSLRPEGIFAAFDLVEVDPDARFQPESSPDLDGNGDLTFGSERR